MTLRSDFVANSLKSHFSRLLRGFPLCWFASVVVLCGSGQIALSATIYWSDLALGSVSGKIQAAESDGSNLRDVITGGCSRGIALDSAAQKIYWADSNPAGSAIFRANLDGSNQQSFGVRSEPSGIALDAGNQKIYVAEAYGVYRHNTDGTDTEALMPASGFFSDPDVALDLQHGKMYYTGPSTTAALPAIWVADLDGSNSHTLVGNTAAGIALDVAGGKMYWTELGEVRRANLDGSSIQDLATLSGKPRGIALDLSGGKMYWGEFTGSAATTRIRRANLDGSGVEDFITGLSNPAFIAVGVPEPSSLIILSAAVASLLTCVCLGRMRTSQTSV